MRTASIWESFRDRKRLAMCMGSRIRDERVKRGYKATKRRLTYGIKKDLTCDASADEDHVQPVFGSSGGATTTTRTKRRTRDEGRGSRVMDVRQRRRRVRRMRPSVKVDPASESSPESTRPSTWTTDLLNMFDTSFDGHQSWIACWERKERTGERRQGARGEQRESGDRSGSRSKEWGQKRKRRSGPPNERQRRWSERGSRVEAWTQRDTHSDVCHSKDSSPESRLRLLSF